ncbi:hypothetical protein ACTFQF_20630 [Aliivibrio fischeri]|uniref:hypothetical protein n=1 Tax=Aliivibrio fischeri TaxID=668 RepID=UPI0007C50C6E|nr:hypothetical protein [Aliivibrio fischeri]MBP3139785.1 hypothetical protein [Aliivibrio fischeri]MBP3154170.1 hypothetical protein [Aliivibrio fischeri]MCE7571904.1 hypothetical protein [Aliivibrio fischeri]
MKKYITILLFSTFLLISGCSEQKKHCDIFNADTSHMSEIYKHYLLKKQKIEPLYELRVIEIDEKGLFLERYKFNELKKHIKQKTQIKDTLIYMKINGWQHDTSIDELSLNNFKKQLNNISNYVSKNKRDVIGIYVKLREEKTSMFRYPTFFNKKKSIHQVSNGNIIEIWDFLKKIKDNSVSDTKIVTVGHSFGADIIFNLMNIDNGAESNENHKYKKNLSGIGNLILLINPTFDALKYVEFRKSNKNKEPSTKNNPIISIFTSESDWITKYVLPAKRIISNLFKQHNYMEETIGENKVLINKKIAQITSIGHFKPFITHRLEMTNKSISSTQYNKLIKNLKSDLVNGINPLNFDKTTLVRNPIIKANTPYLVVQVDKTLIPDHSNIFGKEIETFFHDFLLLSINE